MIFTDEFSFVKRWLRNLNKIQKKMSLFIPNIFKKYIFVLAFWEIVGHSFHNQNLTDAISVDFLEEIKDTSILEDQITGVPQLNKNILHLQQDNRRGVMDSSR